MCVCVYGEGGQVIGGMRKSEKELKNHFALVIFQKWHVGFQSSYSKPVGVWGSSLLRHSHGTGCRVSAVLYSVLSEEERFSFAGHLCQDSKTSHMSLSDQPCQVSLVEMSGIWKLLSVLLHFPFTFREHVCMKMRPGVVESWGNLRQRQL